MSNCKQSENLLNVMLIKVQKKLVMRELYAITLQLLLKEK